MKSFIDFFPVLAFFIAFFVSGKDFFVATAVLMIAMAVQIVLLLAIYRKVSQMHIIGVVFVFLFGGLTLFLRDPEFLKWKVTIVNWLFASAFFLSHYIGKKPVIQRLMEEFISLSEKQWKSLSLMWAFYFALLGAINLYVILNFSTEFWVQFRLFGILGLTLVFSIVQGVWITIVTQHKAS